MAGRLDLAPSLGQVMHDLDTFAPYRRLTVVTVGFCPDVEIPRSDRPPRQPGGYRVNYGGRPCLSNRGISSVVQKTQVRPRNVFFTGWRPSFYGGFERSVDAAIGHDWNFVLDLAA